MKNPATRGAAGAAAARRARAGEGAPARLLGNTGLASPLCSRPDSPPASVAWQRQLHVGHFSFMRAVVQGLDHRDSWERFFRVEGEVTDLRRVRATIAWVRGELAAAARRHDRHGTARLLRIDTSHIADASPNLPSPAALAEARGLDDARQTDQSAAHEAGHGHAAQRQRRRARLIARQLQALRWLEPLVAQAPQPADSVAAWLNPALAAHLNAAGIHTLAQLVDRINGLGQRWHAGIKALGAGKAQRIVAGLQGLASTPQPSPGLQLGGHVATARGKLGAQELAAVVAPATAVRPLEKFITPADLDGARGLYRRPQAQCLLPASTDHQAILAWLRSKHGLTPDQTARRQAHRRQPDAGTTPGMDGLQSLSNTQRAYRKEAERFLLWVVLHQGKALSSVDRDDCSAYLDFLADPQPRSRWCGARGRERWSPLWRPLEGPLSAPARRHALTILKNLHGFLVDQNYLMGNPWAGVLVPGAAGPTVNAGRSFSPALWAFVDTQLALLPARSAHQRLRFGLHLLYATGLRLSEVVAATVDHLQPPAGPADAVAGPPMQGWLLRVVGRGQRQRDLLLPAEVVAELARYLASRGLDADPGAIGNQGAFLLGQASDAAERAPGLRAGQVVNPRQGIAATTFYDQTKAFFTGCACVLRAQGDADGAERLAQASTHWMRHSHASHAIAGGMPVEMAQHNLGHASLATTTAYVAVATRQQRLQAAEAFWKR